MSFHVNLVGRKNLSREIYRQIARAILEGRLRPGDRLSPSRELAESLNVSRMTVNVAYDRLAGEGFVTTRPGAGTFVSESAAPVSPAARSQRPGDALQSRPFWQTFDVLSPFTPPARYDFRTGVPDAALFPHAAWRRCVAQALTAPSSDAGVYGEPAGLPRLRSAIVRQIGFSRGVEASTDDIIVTTGTQQGLGLIARVLLAPGDTVAVEQPGYMMPRFLFTSLDLRVADVPVDQQGIVVAALPKRARAVYVTPSHQFPLAVPMSLQRRLQLLDWAEQNDAAIIEDDYDSEFRFGGRPLESLQSIDSKGRVIYVGSFSKSMLPTLRLGFLVAPRSIRDALLKAKWVDDWHTTGITQAALARFMDEGNFARHIRKMTAVYRERHALISQIVNRDFTGHLHLLPSEAGLHAAAFARFTSLEHIRTIVLRAAERRVAVQDFSTSTGKGSTRVGLMLGYGAISNKGIKEGLRLLRECFA